MVGNVGKILCDLRKRAGMTQQSLGRGLVSVTELSGIENGEGGTDKFTLEALFQRLGKSLDKLELTISADEYQVILMRTAIEDALGNHELQKAETLLAEYEQCVGTEKTLQNQYLLQMKAIYVYLLYRDAAECETLLEQAIDLTFPERFGLDFGKYRLCTQEIQIILLRSFLLLEGGKWDAAEAVLGRTADYLEKYDTDAEEMAKVYPQCMWLWAKLSVLQGNYEKAWEKCRAGKEVLIKNGVLASMAELLKIESACLEYFGRTEEQQNVIRQLEAIRFLYEMAGQEVPQENILTVVTTSRQDDFVISGELILEQRMAKQMSQEELSEDICARETLSRIESGKRTPSRKNLHKMMVKLELDRERYYGFVVADRYEVYEKVRAYNMAIYKKQRKQVVNLLDEIEQEIDMSVPVNRQYVEMERLNYKIELGEITYEQGITEMKKILCYTMPDFQGKVYRSPSRQECVILNGIAIGMRRIGELQEANDLFAQILGKYEKSQVLKRHHAVPLLFIYANYTGFLETEGRLAEAERIGKEGIEVTLQCGRGNQMGHLLGNLACVYERKKNNHAKLLFENCLRHGYYLSKLYGLEKDALVIEKYYNSVFEQKL